eukprot:GHVU01035888.1.p1 GENE.GHVU01035888.1~~GHVU01035888.1.p1  ORF type:complete len:776 (+),score=178.96 GHVU01035888.1:159-2486(+)
MFYVQPKGSPSVVHLFNQDDYFLGYPDAAHDAFIEPALRVKDMEYTGPSPDEFRLWYTEVFGTKLKSPAVERAEKAAAANAEKEKGAESKQQQANKVQAKKSSKKEAEELKIAHQDSATQVEWEGKNTNVKKVDSVLRTWMRPVGHEIDFDDAKPGGRLLARLQMMRRSSELERNETGHSFFGTFNMVNLVCKIEGKIVWRAGGPSEVGERLFLNAGEPLFVIQGAHDRHYYSVYIPSFDIRYPRENQWFVIQTITNHFCELQTREQRQEIERLHRLQMGAKKLSIKEEFDKEIGEYLVRMNNLESNLEFLTSEGGLEMELGRAVDVGKAILGKRKNTHHLGYSDPFYIKQGTFVCRLRKEGINGLDRNQTRMWYDHYQILPHINISREIMWGEENPEAVAVLKGAVKIVEVPEVLAKKEMNFIGSIMSFATAQCLCPEPRLSPVEEVKWTVENVMVHVYVLTARHLENVDVFGKSDPYLKIKIDQAEEVSDRIFRDDLNPDFYEHFVFPLSIPGEAQLTISVWDKAEASEIDKIFTGDQLLGSVIVDLEDRWLALRHRRPDEESLNNLVKVKGRSKRVKMLAPLEPFPIEVLPLMRTTGSGSPDDIGVTTGWLRFLIDMIPEELPYTQLPMLDIGRSDPFQLRLVIWSVSGISVFKDRGQRNDMLVDVKITVTTAGLESFVHKFTTDVHAYANREANFNWRVNLDLQLPVSALSVEYKLLDQDALVADELVYAPEIVSLDDVARLQFKRFIHEEPLIQPLIMETEFDEPVLDPV